MITRRSIAAATLMLGLAACLPPPVVIPPGAPTVHVFVTEEAVRLEPSTVPAGDVYFVIEGPEPAFSIVQNKAAPDAEARGMSQAEIGAVRGGDFQSTQIEAFSVSCGTDEWSEELHWRDCRENVRLTLGEGRYAILGSTGEEPDVAPVMDVLEVVP